MPAICLGLNVLSLVAWTQQNPNLQINDFPSWFIYWLLWEQENW